jgi:LysM repeat protein
VALIAGLILAYSALTGRFGGGVASAGGSPSPSASESSSAFGAGPSASAGRSLAVSPTPTPGPPAPAISYKLYKVLAGDTVSKVAGKFGLKSWELLLANPKVTAPNYILKVGTYINIPPPGQLTPPPPGGPTPTPTPTPTPVAP